MDLTLLTAGLKETLSTTRLPMQIFSVLPHWLAALERFTTALLWTTSISKSIAPVQYWAFLFPLIFQNRVKSHHPTSRWVTTSTSLIHPFSFLPNWKLIVGSLLTTVAPLPRQEFLLWGQVYSGESIKPVYGVNGANRVKEQYGARSWQKQWLFGPVCGCGSCCHSVPGTTYCSVLVRRSDNFNSSWTFRGKIQFSVLQLWVGRSLN